MKNYRFLSILLALLLSLSICCMFAACGTDANDEPQNNGQTNPDNSADKNENGNTNGGGNADSDTTPDSGDDSNSDSSTPDDGDSSDGSGNGNTEDTDKPDTLLDITDVIFADAIVEYTGKVNVITAANIPEGITAVYENNSGKDVGTYEASVSLSGDGYNTLTLYATLTVTKAEIKGVSFPSGSFVYDGTEKVLNTLEGDLPDGVTVEYIDNKATDAGVYTAKAVLTGKNYKDLTLETSLTVERAPITGIKLKNATFEYDGTEKSLVLSGNLPVGVSVSYLDGISSAKEIGIYKITLTLSGANYQSLTLFAYLEITAPHTEPLLDFEGIRLDDGSFVYDGGEKSLAISGTLPETATVEYSGNGQVNAGIYQVSAVVQCEGYNTLFLDATLTISKADITGVIFNDATYTYNGSEFTLSAENIPNGVSAAYAGNKGTNAGTYHATLTLTGDNYNTASYSATLLIKKADITGIRLLNKTFKFKEGTNYSLAISGTLPDGVTVTYNNNSQSKVGTHKVTATIGGDNYNTLVLEAILTITSGSSEGGIMTPEHVFG